MQASDEIRNLLGTYTERIDAGDFEGVGVLFARGCLADEHGNELCRGAAAVAEFYGGGTKLHGPDPGTKHLVTNTVFEVLDEDDGVAVARSTYVVFQAVADLPLQTIITGRYRDTFGRDESGRWHFAERRFIIDQMGDLSHHLTWFG